MQCLPPATFRGLVNLWCLASRGDGRLPGLAAIAFALRMCEAEAAALIAELTAAGLIDTAADGRQAPHNWDTRQFRGDVSTERTRRMHARMAGTSPGHGGLRIRGTVVAFSVGNTYHHTVNGERKLDRLEAAAHSQCGPTSPAS